MTLLLAFKVPAGQDGHERLIRTLRLRHGAYGAPEPAAGVGHVTLHALRHTLASILISQGRDVEFVSRQPGHAHTSTTLDTYSHLFDARRHAKKARRGLEADFGAILGTTKALTVAEILAARNGLPVIDRLMRPVAGQLALTLAPLADRL